MTDLSNFNKTWNNSFVVLSETDISCYIFQNISGMKVILIHSRIPDIVAIGDDIFRH